MMTVICAPCHGIGTIVVHQNGRREWWTCFACGGAGVRAMFGPPTLKIHSPKNKEKGKSNQFERDQLRAARNARKKTKQGGSFENAS